MGFLVFLIIFEMCVNGIWCGFGDCDFLGGGTFCEFVVGF